MCLGVYYTYLSAISTLDFTILIPMGIGVVLGGFIFLILIKFLLNKFHNFTYYSIIGFVLSSIFVLLPNITFSFNNIHYIILLVIGFLLPLAVTVRDGPFRSVLDHKGRTLVGEIYIKMNVVEGC